MEPIANKLKKSNENLDLIENSEAIEYFSEFESLYKQSDLSLKGFKFDLSAIKYNYDEYLNIRKVDAKYVIANIGFPNQRKSSFFNFLITGSYEFPLLQSSKSGVTGETLKPTRIYFVDSKVFTIKIVNAKNNEHTSSELKSLSGVTSCLNELNLCDNIEEIIIEMPSKLYPKQAEKFKDFEFLDLIGLYEINDDKPNKHEEEKSTRLNRLAVERKLVDAVFMFPGGRHLCSTRLIHELWRIGLFSNLDRMRPPKLITTAKFRDNDFMNDSDLKNLLNGFCQNNNSVIRESIIESIRIKFDFKDTNSNGTIEEEDDFIDIENKSKNVRELIKRADSLCVLEMNSNSKENDFYNRAHNAYLSHLESILNDVKLYKQDFEFQEAFSYIMPILEELTRKITAKVKSFELIRNNKQVYKRLSRFFETKSYKKLLDSFNKEIELQALEYFKEIESREFTDALFYSDDDSLSRFNNEALQIAALFELIADKTANSYYRFFEQLKQAIAKNFCASYSNERQIDLDLIKIGLLKQLKDCKRRIIENKANYEEEWNDLYKILKIKETEHQNLFVDIVCNDTQANQSQTSMKKLSNFLKNFSDKLKLKLKHYHDNFLDSQERAIFDNEVKPRLFHTKSSNKMPQLSDLNSSLEISDLKKFYRNPPKMSPDFKTLLEEGRVKSNLSLNYISDDSIQHVQFYIDWSGKSVTCEYNESFIKNKINLLNQNLYKNEKALYPIFISSRPRLDTQTDDEYSLELNFLSADLSYHLEPNHFLIFVFIEAGTPQTRSKYNHDIGFYNKLIKEKLNADFVDNPVVLCYLPQRNLGIGRKRKIMMLFAEHLMLRRFYFVDDDIYKFYEYDYRIGKRKMIHTEQSMYRGLNFMLKILEEESVKQVGDISDDVMRQWDEEVIFLTRTKERSNDQTNLNELKHLREIFRANRLNQSKNEVLDLLNRIIQTENENVILNEMKTKLLGDRSKLIGQVALWNKSSYRSGRVYENRLQTDAKNIKTHLISCERYQVVLFNLDAIKGIHPVSDKKFFFEPLDRNAKAKLVSLAKNRDFSNKKVCEAASLGYKCSDKAHVFYQILNGVTGFLGYYFSFEPNNKLKSKVDSEETLCEIEI